jgi:hypothetical protein
MYQVERDKKGTREKGWKGIKVPKGYMNGKAV